MFKHAHPREISESIVINAVNAMVKAVARKIAFPTALPLLMTGLILLSMLDRVAVIDCHRSDDQPERAAGGAKNAVNE